MPSQSNISEGSRRIARNTAVLYVRMFVLLLVGLYTSRVILNALGQDDFGVYGAVGGVVAMFSILTGAIAGAVSRFLAFELGRGEDGRPDAVFSTTMLVQIGLSLVVLVAAETVGLWFLKARLVIPDGRMEAAVFVLQFSILVFLVNMLAVPYNAAIIAHEKMEAFAWLGIVESLLTLGVAVAVKHADVDKLELYSILMFAVALVMRVASRVYSQYRFAECRFRFSLCNKGIFREIAAYSGWTFLGNGFHVLNTQGVNLLMNLFFGVRVNAARDVAVKLEGAVSKFINSFTTALTPQITKSYAAGEREYMYSLVCKGAKFSWILVWLFALPLFLEAPAIMKLWLVNPPEHSIEFVRISLISMLFMAAGDSFLKAVNATGKVAPYQIAVSVAAVLVFPLSYLCFKKGLPPESSYIVLTTVNFVVLLIRVLMTCRQTGLRLSMVLRDTVLRVVAVSLSSSVLPLAVYLLCAPSVLRMVAVVLVSLLSVGVAAWFLGATRGERAAVLVFLGNRLKRSK